MIASLSAAAHPTSGAAHGNAEVALVVLCVGWILVSALLRRSLRDPREHARPPASADVNARHPALLTTQRFTASRETLNRPKQPAPAQGSSAKDQPSCG